MIADHSKNLGALQQKIAKLESTVSQEVAKVSQSVKDISTLQANLKDKDKVVDQMKTAGLTLKSTLLSEQKKNEDLEAANASMSTELQTVKASLQSLKEIPVQSSEIDENFVLVVQSSCKSLWIDCSCVNRSTKFASLWTSAISELWSLLEQDVSEVILKEKSSWVKLRKPDNIILPPSFALILSNSSAAKAVRFALILAVFSFKEIDQPIYKPTSFLSGSSTLCEAFNHLTECNSEKEAFCRRILLSINSGAEQVTLEAEIRAVVQRMSSHTGGLFPEVQHDLFCTKVMTILQNAAELWLPIQRSQKKFEIDFEPFDPEDDEWDRFPAAGKNATQVAQDSLEVHLLGVFPCVSLVEDGDQTPLTKVIQLRSFQELYLAAQHEATQMAVSVIIRRHSTRPIRQSTAGSNGKSFLGGNSTKG